MTPNELLDYGLIGIIALSFLGSSIIPMPMVPIEALVAAGYLMGMNRLLLFVAVVFASSVGGYTTYFIGSSGTRMLERFNKQKVEATRKHLDKWGLVYVAVSSFIFIVPYDIVALICGMVRMNRLEFFTATVVGKVIRIGIVLALLKYGFG